jgi:hypothetical protein
VRRGVRNAAILLSELAVPVRLHLWNDDLHHDLDVVDELHGRHYELLLSAAHGPLLWRQRLCPIARALPDRDVMPDDRGRLWLRGADHPMWGYGPQRAER